MREKVDMYTDTVLEECYRMKEEFNAQFNSVKELSDYLNTSGRLLIIKNCPKFSMDVGDIR